MAAGRGSAPTLPGLGGLPAAAGRDRKRGYRGSAPEEPTKSSTCSTWPRPPPGEQLRAQRRAPALPCSPSRVGHARPREDPGDAREAIASQKASAGPISLPAFRRDRMAVEKAGTPSFLRTSGLTPSLLGSTPRADLPVLRPGDESLRRLSKRPALVARQDARPHLRSRPRSAASGPALDGLPPSAGTSVRLVLWRPAAAGAGNEQGAHDQAGNRHPRKKRQGHGRERLILDPAPERRHALVGAVGDILHDLAGHLPRLSRPRPPATTAPSPNRAVSAATLPRTSSRPCRSWARSPWSVSLPLVATAPLGLASPPLVFRSAIAASP